MIEQDDRDKPFPITAFDESKQRCVPFDFTADERRQDRFVLEVIDEKYRKLLELDFSAGEE